MFYDIGIDQPEVSNQQWIESLRQFGAFFRSLTAYELVLQLKRHRGPAERLTATANLCAAAGAQVEDSITQLVALMCWQLDDSIRLADVALQCTITSDDDPVSDGYMYDVARAACQKKRVRISSAGFARSLLAQKPEDVLAALGIPPISSTSGPVAREQEAWVYYHLPRWTRKVTEILNHETTLLLQKIHNKVKHGPQAVMVRWNDYCKTVGAKHNVTIETSMPANCNEETLRVLFDGANTSNTEDSYNLGNAASCFVFDDPEQADYLLAKRIYPISKFMYFVSSAITQQKVQPLSEWRLPETAQEIETWASEKGLSKKPSKPVVEKQRTVTRKMRAKPFRSM